MKKIVVSIFLLISFFLYGDHVYGPFEYQRTNSEPIKWSPEEGIYNNTIYLGLTAEYGKIFYIINGSFNKKEPKEYKNQIILEGREGSVVDYEIIAILEKENSNIELYSRTYRIDRTQRYEQSDYSIAAYYTKKVSYEKNKIRLTYEFNNNYYNLSYGNREFIFPGHININKDLSKELVLEDSESKDSIFLVNCSYHKEGKIYTEIHPYLLELDRPNPPSFGSLYWGQFYRQSYKIRIKPDDPDDTIYYWLREWKSDEYIVGPPLQDKSELWEKYENPIELKTKYGNNGITGIAAFSLRKNGKFSEIAGPFYFKITDLDNTIEQVFENEIKKKTKKKVVYLDDKVLENNLYIVKNNATIKFEDFDKDDRFYFTFKSKNSDGKSELIPCEEEFKFINNDINPVEIDLFLTNGEKLGSLKINSEKMIYPVMKDYYGNYVDLSSDTIIDFYMPENKVRYELTTNINQYLDVSEKSDEFKGSLKISGKNEEEVTFRIKFGAFNESDKLIGESDDYYFRIDKKNPQNDVTSDGIDFNVSHNEKQILKLIKPEKEGDIYYRLSKKQDWILYTKPITFFPPLIGQYSINIYIKFVDEANNERENKEPYKLVFDTRGIFVDEDREFSGNGTESSPYNSLNRAIEFAKRKNIKLLYIISDSISSVYPIKIDSDIIIQPYNKDNVPVAIMDSKSIFTKKNVYFDVTKNGYLELRNIDFILNSGKYFSVINDSKAKFYNLQFSYTSNDDFTFIENKNGKIGIYNLILEVTDNPENFNFIDTRNSTNYLKNILINSKALNTTIFNIEKANYFIGENFSFDIYSDNQFNFANISYSDVSLNKVVCTQKGNFKNAVFYNLVNGNLYLKESNFFSEGNNPFEIVALKEKNAQATVIESLFWLKKSSSVIGFNLNNSDIVFERSIINAQDIIDYSYNFRGINSNIDLRSSVIRNLNCGSSVSFVLDNSTFKGANNSVFNVNTKSKSFNFWVTDKADITSVNSIYIFNKKNHENAFIYLNNINYDLLKPVWYSNVVSTDNIILENLEKKDVDFIIKDFTEKNIFYNFTNEFNFEDDLFFIPVLDSPILQGGLPEYSSPITIPEKDFFNKNRIIPGIGIDIGAVQKSGNF